LSEILAVKCKVIRDFITT